MILEYLVCHLILVARDPKEIPGLKVFREIQEHRVVLASKVVQVVQEVQELKVFREIQEHKAVQV